MRLREPSDSFGRGTRTEVGGERGTCPPSTRRLRTRPGGLCRCSVATITGPRHCSVTHTTDAVDGPGRPVSRSPLGALLDMSTQTTPDAGDFAHLGHQEKLECLRGLSDLVWDLEDQLAAAKTTRARLMTSLQQDLRCHAA
jgi:hypothetical protein